MAPIPIDRLRRYYATCDPMKPLTDPNDPRYVELDDTAEVRGDDGSCVDTLRSTILMADGEGRSCQLFTGFPGSGKTTELNRLKRDLEGDPENPCYVIYLEAEDYLDRYTPLTITDMLRVLAYHLDREATLVEGGDPDRKPGYLTRLWDWLQSDVQLKEMGFEQYGAKLMLEIKNNPNFRQKAEEVLQLRFQDFADEAARAIRDAVLRIRTAKGYQRIVLIVDDLEKKTALRPEDREQMEASVESVFSNHSEWLRLPVHTIYTFPLWLRFRTTELSTRYDGQPLTLSMVKVRRRDGSPHERGLQKLEELITLRIDDMDGVFGNDRRQTLLPLIEASGGYPRDLLRLVRDVITRAKTYPLQPQQVQRAIALLAESYKMVTLLADLDLLVHVANHHSLPTGSDKLRAASWLFDRLLVLTYRDGEEWYDLHPLVRRSELVSGLLDESRNPRT